MTDIEGLVKEAREFKRLLDTALIGDGNALYDSASGWIGKLIDALTAATPPSEPKRIEVDIGAALAALTSSPELCAKFNEMIGGPALVEAHAEIDRLNLILGACILPTDKEQRGND